MELSFVNIALIIASSQGLFTSIIIITRYRDSLADRLLSLLTFCYSLILLNLLLWDLALVSEHNTIAAALVGLPFLIGPLYYLYVKYLTSGKERFSNKDYIHFLPFVFLETALLILLPAANEISEKTQPILIDNKFSLDDIILNWLILLHIIIYAVLIIRRVRIYARKVTDIFSTLDKIRLTWINYIVGVLIISFSVFFFENLLQNLGAIETEFTISSVVVACSICIFNFSVLIKIDSLSTASFTQGIKQLSRMVQGKDENGKNEEEEKYKKSGLKEEMLLKTIEDLDKLMLEKQPYLDSELNLKKLSDMLEVPPHHLSEILNTRYKENFFEFINRYRIEKVKKDLLDPGKDHLTILAIAFDAGFKSKSSFNAIFKRVTGSSPSEYKKTGR